MTDKFLNITQVAEALGVRERVIQNFVDTGSIPHRKIGKAVRFRWSDILTWWETLPGDMALKKHSAKFMDRYSDKQRNETSPSDTDEPPLTIHRGARRKLNLPSQQQDAR